MMCDLHTLFQKTTVQEIIDYWSSRIDDYGDDPQPIENSALSEGYLQMLRGYFESVKRQFSETVKNGHIDNECPTHKGQELPH